MGKKEDERWERKEKSKDGKERMENRSMGRSRMVKNGEDKEWERK